MTRSKEERAARHRGSRAILESVELGKLRAIVIEDDADMRAALGAALESAGVLVRSFAGARDALDDLRRAPADVVITDLDLPDLGGVELAGILRADPATAHLPILAISGAIDLDATLAPRFDAYLRKPLDLAVLPDLVRALEASARLAAEGPHD